MLYQVIAGLDTPLSFILAGVYLLLVFNAGGGKWNEGIITEVLQLYLPKKFFYFKTIL